MFCQLIIFCPLGHYIIPFSLARATQAAYLISSLPFSGVSAEIPVFVSVFASPSLLSALEAGGGGGAM